MSDVKGKSNKYICNKFLVCLHGEYQIKIILISYSPCKHTRNLSYNFVEEQKICKFFISLRDHKIYFSFFFACKLIRTFSLPAVRFDVVVLTV